MSVSISGILLDPFGEPASFAEVKFITWQGANDVLTTAPAVFKTSAGGAYAFSVEFGTFTVQVRYNQSNGKFQTIKQKVIVNSTTVADTLGELLLFNEPLTPPEIAYVEQLVAEAEGYRDEAEGFALASEANSHASEGFSQDSSGYAQDSAQSAQVAADLVASIAPVPLNGGVWESEQEYTAYNQYMIYNGEAYSPRPETTLPYTVGATPDLNFTYQIKLNSLQLLSGLAEPSDLDKSYRRAATVAEIEHGDFPVNSRLTVIDRGDAPFNVVQLGAYVINGSDVLDAGSGNVAVFIKLSKEQDVVNFGAKAQTGFDNSTILTEAAKNNDLYMARKSGTYESGKVVPALNFSLDAGFSEIKLTSLTQPLFFDNSLQVSNGTFELRNAKIDLNKDNVTAGNLSGGCVWLGKGNAAGSSLEWDTVIIENVDCENAYRVALNLLSIDRVFVRNYSLRNSGIAGSGFFSYGGATENCRKVILEDIVVRNTYGFGWHLYRCDYVDACNVEFTSLTRDGTAIGFTLTESKKVHIRNHVAQTDGDALEINASKDVIVENFDINGGNRGLLLGDNGTGIDNERITLRNGVVTGGGAHAAAINYCHELLCECVRFNGPISVITTQGDRASDLRFKSCQIAQNISGPLADRRFIHEQTRFLDCVYSQNENTFEMMDTGGVDLAQDEYIVIPIEPVLNKATVFYVEVYGEFTSAGAEQMGWRRYQCVYKGVADASLNDLLITLEDEERGSIAARYLTLEVVSGEMRATNKGATTINGNFWLNGVRRTKAKARP